MFSIIIPGSSDASQTSGGPTSATQTPAPKFPIYLLPSFPRPFRRRRQSSISGPASPPSESNVPDLSTSPTEEPSPVESPVDELSTPLTWPSRSHPSCDDAPLNHPTKATKLSRIHPDTIRCTKCATDLAFSSQIVSKAFHGRFGRAYLVSPPSNVPKGPGGRNLVNVRIGKPQTRELVTGAHVVADIFCVICQAQLGWKYIDASDPEQAYKIGKFILELRRTMVYKHWEDITTPEILLDGMRQDSADTPVDDEAIVFNSEDEDECEDIFSGTWSPELAKKRRNKKVNRRAWTST